MDMFSHFKISQTAEAVDEYGVWAKCIIKEVNEDSVKVTFPPWPADYDRVVTQQDEVRPLTQTSRKRSGRLQMLSVKVILVKLLRHKEYFA